VAGICVFLASPAIATRSNCHSAELALLTPGGRKVDLQGLFHLGVRLVPALTRPRPVTVFNAILSGRALPDWKSLHAQNSLIDSDIAAETSAGDLRPSATLPVLKHRHI